MAISHSDIDTALKLALEASNRRHILAFNKTVIDRLNSIDTALNSYDHAPFIEFYFAAANAHVLESSRLKFTQRMMHRIQNSRISGVIGTDQISDIRNISNRLIDMYLMEFNRMAANSVTNTITEKAALLANKANGDEKEYQKLFKAFMENRTGLLLVNSVQNSAEQTKQTIAQETNRQLRSSAPDAELLNKTWVATLDDKTRPWHADADGQRVNIDSLFLVGNELMSRPADTSHGASLANVINCRCCSEFNI